MPKTKGDLSPKQALFVQEYLIDLNATRAAKRAGYSARSAEAIGRENLRRPQVLKAIQKAMDKRAKRMEISQDRVIEEIARIAFADIGEVVEWGPGYVKLKEGAGLTPEQRAAIAEVKQTADGQQIKLHDKLGALEKLAKHLKLYDETGNGGQDKSLTIIIKPPGDEPREDRVIEI